MLGCPLPRGASLAERSTGEKGGDGVATETYRIPASAHAIAGFYEREMRRAGWRKAAFSTEHLLYFERAGRTVGVLVSRDGGGFTLMGS
jgi:hypothetical protein